MVPVICGAQAETKDKAFNLTMQKILTLGGDEVMFQSIESICEDEQKNIYVLDRKAYKVYKFSPQGKLLLSLGSKGQGPGEFSYPQHITVSRDQKLVVSEDMVYVSFFKLDGTFIERIKVQPGLALTYINPNLYYAWQWTKKGNQQILINQKGEILKRLFEKNNKDFSVSAPDESGRLVRTNYSATEYTPHFLSSQSGGRSIFAMSDQYKILLVNKKGEIEREISRKIKPGAISPRERKLFTARIQGEKYILPPLRKEFIKKIPGTRNYFDNILLSEKYIYIFRIPKDIAQDSTNYPVDVFNLQGHYLGSSMLSEKPLLISSKNAYVLKEVEDDILLVKFRLSL